MRRLLWLGVVVAAIAAPRIAEAQRPKIAVSPFLDRSRPASRGGTPATSALSGQVADALITELAKLQRYDVVERVALERVIAEKKLTIADITDASTAADAAKIVGATLIVTGSIPEAGLSKQSKDFRVTLDTRLIDVRTTRAVWATTTEGTEDEQSAGLFGTGRRDDPETMLTRAARRAVTKLLYEFVWFLDQTKLPLEASGAVRNDKFFLDLGAKAGILAGDVFDVKMLSDPFKVGDKWIRDETNIGTVKVDQVEPEFSAAPVAAEMNAKLFKKDKKGNPVAAFAGLSLKRAGAPPAPPPPPPAPPPPPPPSPQVPERAPSLVAVVTTVQGQVRASPAATAAIVATMKRDSRLEVIDVKNGWCRVRTTEGKEGWIIATAISSQIP